MIKVLIVAQVIQIELGNKSFLAPIFVIKEYFFIQMVRGVFEEGGNIFRAVASVK